MNQLTWDHNGFYLDGEPFRIIAGDIHYFRIFPQDWEKRLELAVDFGLNAVQTYVPWNAHEPNEGEYDFEGMLNLAGFLELCQKKGLKVLLRPSPYICSEWELGGLPSWLLADREIVLRSHDPKYLAAVKRYYEHLIPVFLPYLATNGGPILAVAIENEYGSYGNDHQYINALADMLRAGGVDVPLYTTDGATPSMLAFGRYTDGFFGVNYRCKVGTSVHSEQITRETSSTNPFFIGEFWSGRSMHWGETFWHRDPTDVAKACREALELNGNICFYMFSGGTNFGFMGGANWGRPYSPRENTLLRYIPHTTSYDVDAIISEDGRPTEKYYLCREVLDDYFGRPKRARNIPTHPTQSCSVALEEIAPLFDNLDVLTERHIKSIIPHPMEDYGQSYGLILYSTALEALRNEEKKLYPPKFRDRANLYVDGEWFATYMRDRGERSVKEGAVLEQCGTARRIDMLVENIGRVNFGPTLTDERKGAEESICYGNQKLFDYEIRTLPLKNVDALHWKKGTHTDGLPCFFKGKFDAREGIDSYVSFANLGHGYIWINGFNLGRYDSAGPQMTLYVPGHLLRSKGNTLVVLDIEPRGARNAVQLLDAEVLEGDAEVLS